MLIGIVGAPNKGKSTLFAAMTMLNVAIADYPFTTIKPNHGIAYVSKKCVDSELGVHCNPRNSLCINGTRFVPIEIVDVAGLVPGSHIGRGMGNQFLSDLSSAEMLIQVIDASGTTDINGNRCEGCDPVEEIKMVQDELAFWLSDIIKRHAGMLRKRADGAAALREVLTGLKIDSAMIESAANELGLSLSGINWNEGDTLGFARALLRMSKPMLIAANKIDMLSSAARKRLEERLAGYNYVECSAEIELMLRRASASGLISYLPGSAGFSLLKGASKDQEDALEYARKFLASAGTTGVQELLNKAVFEVLKMIVVYPVEDENKYTDHYGNVLPDALLLPRGSTAADLAMAIHTNLAKGMLYAVNARTKMRLKKDYVLKDNDVIRIVSAAKE
ncbi:MAG: redox-regulated ATPase YchF [Candidatus Micrarchaeaceae archaeon]